jgi:Fe-S cluster biogenesis protein NfuA
MSAQSAEEQARRFLSDNVPQIKAHGGSFEIESVDEETGELELAIGGACSGCGIAPMTMQAIERRLPEHVEEIRTVSVTRTDGPSAAVLPQKIEEMESMEEYADYRPPF